MEVVNLKERPSKSPQKAQTQAKWLYIFCCRLFISFIYSIHVARSAASALSLIYYYWLQGCSNRVMEILDWLPEPRMDPFRLLRSNGSSWMTGGRRGVQQQEHTLNMLRQHGTTLTHIPTTLSGFFFLFSYIHFSSLVWHSSRAST